MKNKQKCWLIIKTDSKKCWRGCWRNCNLHTGDGNIRWYSQDFPGGPVVKNLPADAQDVGLIPGQGTKFPYASGQLRSCAATSEPVSSRAHTPHLERSLWPRWKIPHASTKTQHSQINTYFKKCLFKGFSGGPDGKEPAWNAGDPGSVRGLGRSPGEEKGNPLQYSCLKNSMRNSSMRSQVGSSVHGVTKSWTWLSD